MAYINGKQVPQRISAYQISEAEAVNLSCYVNSKPLSHITLTKDIGSTISEEESSDWLNHTINSSQCSDTGTYKCTGLSTGFNNTEKTFELNVTCKYLMTRFFIIRSQINKKSETLKIYYFLHKEITLNLL